MSEENYNDFIDELNYLLKQGIINSYKKATPWEFQTEFSYLKEIGKKIMKYWDNKEIFSNLIEALKNEHDKYYADSANYYTKVFEDIIDEFPNWREHKGYFKVKISDMRYKDAYYYYNEKEYDTAIDKLREMLNNEYTTGDIKHDSKILLARCLYRLGKKEYNDKSFNISCDHLKEALRILPGCESKFSHYEIDEIKKYLKEMYTKLAYQSWSDYNTTCMEEAIHYIRQARNYDESYSYCYGCFECPYYLYKAYYESDSNRTSNLENAKRFAEHRPENRSMYLLLPNYRVYDTDIDYLYRKSEQIDKNKNKINNKKESISNLNYELNSLKNKINKTESLIKIKKGLINNKNEEIIALNQLADTLISNGGEISNQTDEAINEEKNNIKEIESNINNKQDIINELKEYEKEKKEDIENFKKNNDELKKKNDQLILILNSLESKIN